MFSFYDNVISELEREGNRKLITMQITLSHFVLWMYLPHTKRERERKNERARNKKRIILIFVDEDIFSMIQK